MINTGCDPYKLRIANTELGLVEEYFYLKGIAVPSVIEYKDHSTLVAQAAGGQGKQGYSYVKFTWTKPDPKTVYKLKTLIDDVLDGTRIVYLTIPLNDGSLGGRGFIDVSGIPHPIVVTEAKNYGDPGIVYSTLQFFVNNLTIINNPATF